MEIALSFEIRQPYGDTGFQQPDGRLMSKRGARYAAIASHFSDNR